MCPKINGYILYLVIKDLILIRFGAARTISRLTKPLFPDTFYYFVIVIRQPQALSIVF